MMTWLRTWLRLRRLRRALIEGDPEVRRMLEEYGQRKVKR